MLQRIKHSGELGIEIRKRPELGQLLRANCLQLLPPFRRTKILPVVGKANHSPRSGPTSLGKINCTLKQVLIEQDADNFQLSRSRSNWRSAHLILLISNHARRLTFVTLPSVRARSQQELFT